MRPDLVFSYWIYFWYILYAYKFTTFSPKFPLIIGLIDNVIMLLLMLLYGTSYTTIFYFIIINTCIKIFPLYYLRSQHIRGKDVYFTVILFFIFILWLQFNKQSLIGNSKLIYNSILYGKNKTPFMELINKMKNNFKNIKVI
jgi:hypothetical protein